MSRFGRFGFLAFLDLVSCAFGAVLLLFLIVSSALLVPQELSKDRTLLVRCRHAGGARGEVGIEFRRPGTTEWIRESARSCVAARSNTETGAEALLIVLDPSAGEWEFRPFLADFPEIEDTSDSTQVRLEIYGQRISVEGNGDVSKLANPGDAGALVSVHVSDKLISN